MIAFNFYLQDESASFCIYLASKVKVLFFVLDIQYYTIMCFESQFNCNFLTGIVHLRFLRTCMSRPVLTRICLMTVKF